MKRAALVALYLPLAVACSRDEPLAIRPAPERPDAAVVDPTPTPPPEKDVPPVFDDSDDLPPTPPTHLPGKTVEAFVATKRPSVNAACAPSPCRPAAVTLRLDIDPAGVVTSASSTGDPAVGACIVRLAKKWKLPASKGGGAFAIPFIFKC